MVVSCNLLVCVSPIIFRNFTFFHAYNMHNQKYRLWFIKKLFNVEEKKRQVILG